ncbi:MAG: 50S ribosomal protein L18 [Candidatus Babeliales bacterium]
MKKQKQRRAFRVRNGIKRHSSLHRVSVFKSLKYIYAQLIDDNTHKTLASCSSLELKDAVSGDKKATAHHIGLELAKRAKDLGVESAVFDRGSFLYHGRIKALAEGLREGGLKI